MNIDPFGGLHDTTPGYLVLTKHGHKARTKHSDGKINGKIPVYLLDDKFQETGAKMLCDPTTLKQIGFID